MTFTPKTIYRDLMKQVHPDLHPTMTNATARTQQVNAVKNNVQALRMLAISWGFIQPTANDMAGQRGYTFTRPQAQTQPNYQRTYMPRTVQDLLLFANRSYVGQNVFVRIKIHGRQSTHRVIRTTAKCVVVDFYGLPKTVRMANVIRREQA
jgi:hypothetical protein